MRAAVSTEYGPPEVVRIEDVAKPEPGDDQLLVKVIATTVNRTDCGYRAAKPFILRFFTGIRKPKRTILGTEFAGEVEATGPAAVTFAVGDRVFGYVEGPFSAHAEYLAIAVTACVAAIPSNVGFEEAAAATEGSHYALANIRAAKIGSGAHVLVNGGTGAIGSAAIQLLKDIGAHVTVACRTEHVELVERLGVDRVIDARKTDFTADDHTYDVVFDAVGKSSFARCKRLLKPKGVYLSTDLGPFPWNPLLALVSRRVMFPFPKIDQTMIEHIAGLLESGAFKPLLDRRYPLEQIVDAYRYVETGEKLGNVVINVA